MALNLDWSVTESIFTGTNLGLAGNLTGLIITAVTIFVITRNTKNITSLAFPVLLAYSRLGLSIHPVLIILSAIFWTINVVGTNTIGSALGTARQSITEMTDNIRYTKNSPLTRKQVRNMKKELNNKKIARLSSEYQRATINPYEEAKYRSALKNYEYDVQNILHGQFGHEMTKEEKKRLKEKLRPEK